MSDVGKGPNERRHRLVVRNPKLLSLIECFRIIGVAAEIAKELFDLPRCRHGFTQITQCLTGFIQLYERHIVREEAELLPMAARLLDDIELDRIGLSMRRRREGAATP